MQHPKKRHQKGSDCSQDQKGLGCHLGLSLGCSRKVFFSQFRKEQIDLGNVLPTCLYLLFLAFNWCLHPSKVVVVVVSSIQDQVPEMVFKLGFNLKMGVLYMGLRLETTKLCWMRNDYQTRGLCCSMKVFLCKWKWDQDEMVLCSWVSVFSL